MTGTRLGTNGGRRIFAAILAIVLLLGAACTVNALSILDEAAAGHIPLPAWQPFSLEYTSLAGSILALPIALLAERLALGRTFLRAFVLIPASLLFSAVHVGAMIGLRHLLWWSHGASYRFGGPGLLYEYRKDAITFAVVVAILFVARRWPQRAAASAPPAMEGRLILANGRRHVEIDVAGLLAARGGGNYTELIFAEGPTKLLRTTLAAAETVLATHGFRRTHKSWLVNLRRVRSVARTGSGDYCLVVGDSLEVPLSRRSSSLLDEIRTSATAPSHPPI